MIGHEDHGDLGDGGGSVDEDDEPPKRSLMTRLMGAGTKFEVTLHMRTVPATTGRLITA